MRCARCGYDNPDNPRTCARCGLALADSSDPARDPVAGAAGGPADDPGGREVSDPAEGTRPSPIQPSWRRPAEAPAESPPWSGSVDAAPWQTPPRRGTPANRPATEPPPASRPAGNPSVAAEPPRPGSAVPAPLGRGFVVVLAVEVVLAVVYAIFSLGPRRGVFAALATDPAGVGRADATASDRWNLLLFAAVGLCTLVALVLGGWWASRVRRSRPVRWGPAWWIVTVAAAVLVAVALVMHAGGDTGRIATGYVFLGVGCLLLAGSAAWALLVVRRHRRLDAADSAAGAVGRAGSAAEHSQAGPDSEGPGHLVR
jgi:hypothetical protein